MKKLCVCGRSQTFPICDGNHSSEGWSCAAGSDWLELGFCAGGRYQNLARKLASHFGAALCEGNQQASVGRLYSIVDGTDLERVFAVNRRVEAKERIIVSLGIPAQLLAPVFPNSRVVDLGEDDLHHAFRHISKLVDGGELPVAVRSQDAQRSCFVSHAVADEPLVVPVKSYLERHFGLDMFMCADSIPTGTDWHAEIMQALRDKELFVFLLSEASAQSGFCAFELGGALALEKAVAIISLDGSPPPAFIQHVQLVDVPRTLRQRPWLEVADVVIEELLRLAHGDAGL